jgi:hypothetical protein
MLNDPQSSDDEKWEFQWIDSLQFLSSVAGVAVLYQKRSEQQEIPQNCQNYG